MMLMLMFAVSFDLRSSLLFIFVVGSSVVLHPSSLAVIIDDTRYVPTDRKLRLSRTSYQGTYERFIPYGKRYTACTYEKYSKYQYVRSVIPKF